MDLGKTEHSLALLAMLKELRRIEFICDVELKIGTDIVPAHKVVLAASSDFFVRHFSTFGQSNHPIEVPEITPAAFRICVDYMYEGVTKLTLEIVKDVLDATKILNLVGLTKNCEKFLLSHVSIGTCLDVARLAEMSGLVSLKHIADKFSIQYFDLVIRTEGFLNLKPAEVGEYMHKLMWPEQKWEAALQWVKVDFVNRKFEFPTFLEIMLPKCSFELLFHTMWSELPVMKIQECSALVSRAIFEVTNASKLSPENCFSLLEIAGSFPHQCPEIKRKLLWDYVAANFDTLGDKEGFRNLSGEDIVQILESSNAKIFRAEQLWERVLIWIKGDLQYRKKFLLRILRKIQWKHCPFQYFLNHVFNDFLVKYSKSCVSLTAKTLLNLMKEGDITHTNWFTLLEIKRKHDDVFSTDYLEKIIVFAAVNFSQISTAECFGKLCFSDLAILLQRHEVRASCTDAVIWEAAMNWIKRDAAARMGFLRELLECLALEQWSFGFLYQSVLVDVLVKETAEAEKYVSSVVLKVLSYGDITIHNCYDLYLRAKIFEEFQGVRLEILRYFVECFETVSAQNFFVSLDEAAIQYILSSDTFTNDAPELKWKRLFDWVRGDKDRERLLPTIVEKLCLINFRFDFLEKEIFCQSRIQDDGFCKEQCISAMLHNLTYCDINHVNWFDLLELIKSQETPKDELLEKIKQFAAANFLQITHSAHFHKLTLDEVLSMLNSPEISSASPHDQIGGVLRWMDENEHATDDDLIKMIRTLKLEGFPFQLLFDKITNDKYIKPNSHCTELFLSGIQCGLNPGNLSKGNWFPLLEIASAHGRKKYLGIIEVTLDYVSSHYSTINLQPSFNQIGIDDFKAILTSPNLKCSEEVKAASLLRWVAHNDAARWPYLPDLFRLIELHKLNTSFIREEIFANPLIERSEECKTLMLNALLKNTRENSNNHSRKRDRDLMNGVDVEK